MGWAKGPINHTVGGCNLQIGMTLSKETKAKKKEPDAQPK